MQSMSLHRHHRSHSHTGAEAASVRRKPSATRDYEERVLHTRPWEQMSHTYTWVAEQGTGHRTKPSSRPTEEWVLKQQIYFPEEEVMVSRHQGHTRSSSIKREVPTRRKTWEEAVYRYEIDAERWMRHEQESRRMADERQRARARIQEEIRRIDERIQIRRAEERRMIEELRAQALASMRERERREQKRIEKLLLDIWEKHEARWTELLSSTDALAFKSIPWPLVSPPRRVEDIIPSDVTSFLFSPAHSQSVSMRERIRRAQLRWHPDRFRRLINRVEEADKASVEEGVGIIARCLNELMEREKGR